MRNAGYEFEDFAELFVKGFVKAPKDEDEIGVDGYLYDMPVQLKCTIHKTGKNGYSQCNPCTDYDIVKCLIVAVPVVLDWDTYTLDHEHFIVRLVNSKDMQAMNIFSTSRGGRGAYVQNRKNKAMQRLYNNSNALMFDSAGHEMIFDNDILR